MRKSILLSLAVLLAAPLLSQKIGIEESVIERFGKFAPESIEALQWMKGADQYSFAKENDLWVGSPKGKTKKKLALTDLNRITGLNESSFPSIKWLKPSTSGKSFTPNSFYFHEGNEYIKVDLKAKSSKVIGSHPADAENRDFHVESGNLAYTKENNLYLNFAGREFPVTNNKGDIVSGQAIARYEFGIGKGTFWSDNGQRLAFYEKDETNVTGYPIIDYDQHPATVSMVKYPMAGSSSEIASVGVFDCESKKTTYLNLEGGKKDDSFYATNVGWDPDGKHIYVTIVNREQDHIWLKKYDATTGKEIAVLFEESDKEYVEPEHAPYFLPGRDARFLWFSERNGFNNLYLYDREGHLLNQTSESFDIKSIIAHDPSGSSVYVLGTGSNATESHVFKLEIPSMKLSKITKEAGYHSGSVSHSGKHIIDRWSSLEVPSRIDIVSSTGKKGVNLLNSHNPLEGRKYGTTEIFELESFDGTNLWARMIKPSDFDSRKQYPVLVYTYNGPHVQLVTNRWLGGAPLWMHSMAEEGYIVFTVDGRGSANRGIDFEQAVFRNMGSIEIEDQAHCANWLKDQPYTDPDRFAVHGWSYGGFMTTSLMLKKPDVFKVGVAGGPVMDWSLYEVMYTERYMDTPQTNKEGFEQTDLKRFVKDLRGDLLLIHGTSDNTVVLQHNLNFNKECIKQGVQVDYYPYPNYEHNVRGKDRAHLMVKILGYIMEHL